MSDQPKNGTTLEEILEILNTSFTKTQEMMNKRFDAVDKRFDVIESDIGDLKMDVRDLNENMVRKDTLERLIQGLKDDSTKIVRKTNDKVVVTVRILRDKSVLSEAEAQPILSMEPFPVPR